MTSLRTGFYSRSRIQSFNACASSYGDASGRSLENPTWFSVLERRAMAVDVDVIVVGCGPGGEVAASLIGQGGYRVAVLDKASAPYGQPRMSTLDGEVARVLQHAADPREAMTDAIKAPRVLLFGADGETVPPIDWDYRISGHWSHYSLHQPNIEAAMERRISESRSVEIHWGVKVVGIAESGDEVTVQIETSDADGDTRRGEMTASYILGFDGASSLVRKVLGIELDVLREHDDKWILTDFDALRPLPEAVTRTQYHMDPTGPWFAGPNGANRCRTDVRVMDDEDIDVELNSDHGYQFLEDQFGLTRDDVRMTRRVMYRFRSHIARSMRVGRVFIGGDAAHSMTPYMGQGACTAMRDAANIAWKLRLVLAGEAHESLLDTYESERLPHSEFFVRGSLAIFDFVNELDLQKAAVRDSAARAGETEFPPIPGLSAGVVRRDPSGALAAHAGQLAPQGVVRRGSFEGHLDDLVGYGGQFISSLEPRELLGDTRIAELESLGVHVLSVVNGDGDGIGDADGTYSKFWQETDSIAFLARADHYMFGVSTSPEDACALVDDFVRQVCRSVSPAHRGTPEAVSS